MKTKEFEVIKEITLDTDQFKRIYNQLKTINTLEDALPKIMMDMLEELTNKQQRFWDTIAALFDFESAENAQIQNLTLEVNWIQKKVQLVRKIEKGD